MNEVELKVLWQTTNDKLQETILINRKNTEEITRLKVYSILRSMKPTKLFTLAIGMLWVGTGVIALTNIYSNGFSEANKFFLYSATAQVLLTAIALFIYIYQLVAISQVDVSNPILQTQIKISKLNLTTLWSARILFLQLPLWTIFWWNQTMLATWTLLQWATTLTVTGAFAFLAAWLFFNIRYENRNKKWFKLIFSGKEWNPLIESMELLDQIKQY